MKNTIDFRILIIDDNEEIHKDFIKVLQLNEVDNQFTSLDTELFGDEEEISPTIFPKFKIDTALQGQEGVVAIKKAVDDGSPYALAFVDIRMPPGWDGIETIKHIWALDQDIQIVICTAYSDYSWENTVEQLGVSDNLLVLKKPFDNVAVRQLACALTKKWQLLQESKKNTAFLEESIKERTSSLLNSLSLVRATIESSTDGIFVVNNDGKLVDYNQQLIKLWDIPKSLIATKEGKKIKEHIATKVADHDAFIKNIEQTSKNLQITSKNVFHCKDTRIIETFSQPQKIDKKTIGRVWSFRDVTHRVRLEKKLEFQATHDDLTNLSNRVLLQSRLIHSMSIADRHKHYLGVLFFDLDRFKLVNDSISHNAGDELLKNISERLITAVRAEDTVARIGGDEFVIILTNINHIEVLVMLTNKLLDIIRKPVTIAGIELIITSSVGITVYPNDGTTVNELLRNADLAMYSAKRHGGNQFHFYTNDLNKKSLHRLKKENQLRIAVKENQFFIHYQPQFDLKKEKLIAVEALIRWRHPTKGIIYPIDFIPLAEETGLIIPIGNWVLKQACLAAKHWQEKGYQPFRVGVNISEAQFKQGDLISTIKQILNETRLEANYLELELTENIIINNLEIIATITELKKLGVNFALDDFGAGNSSLSYLREIPLDRLKIDQSFIQNIAKNEKDEVLIKAIISMAENLNLGIIAEGVETQAQLNFLKNEQCQNIQGFYFSKPLSLEDMEKALSKLKK